MNSEQIKSVQKVLSDMWSTQPRAVSANKFPFQISMQLALALLRFFLWHEAKLFKQLVT